MKQFLFTTEEPVVVDYCSILSVRKTHEAIKYIKDAFEKCLSESLNLSRVAAPLFLTPESGLNDNLSGWERPVRFKVPSIRREFEIVHSLAKWKRTALKKYGFKHGEGLYTDMNAIRRDEVLSNIHSFYVDQWDWEKVILAKERNIETLIDTVRVIFDVFKKIESHLATRYPVLEQYLPKEVTFISAQALEHAYPNIAPKERENIICKKHKAVFITQIGGINESGEKHDDRAPDYDDWTMNGDLLFFYPVLDKAIEMTSMGIRVNSERLVTQLKEAKCEERLQLKYHQEVLNNQLPLTIGGGLGQSRMCMYLLGKVHIGEVHPSIWDEKTIQQCEKAGIPLL